VKSIRDCFECIGTCGLFVFGFLSIVTLLVVVVVSMSMGMADTFFQSFFINLGGSWVFAVLIALCMFYWRSYKKENEKMLKGKTKFQMTCQDIVDQGVEIQYREACCRCLTCCLPSWRICAALCMCSDVKDFKVVKNVQIEEKPDVIVQDECAPTKQEVSKENAEQDKK